MSESISSVSNKSPDTEYKQNILSVAAVVGGIVAIALHFLIALKAPISVQVSMSAFEPFSNGAGFAGILGLFAATAHLLMRTWQARLFGVLIALVSLVFLYFSYFGGAVDFALSVGPEHLSEKLAAPNQCLPEKFSEYLQAESIAIAPDLKICGG